MQLNEAEVKTLTAFSLENANFNPTVKMFMLLIPESLIFH